MSFDTFFSKYLLPLFKFVGTYIRASYPFPILINSNWSQLELIKLFILIMII